MPTDDVNATLRAEFDSRYHELRTISAQRHVHVDRTACRSTVGWSKRGVHRGAARLQRLRAPLEPLHQTRSTDDVHTTRQPASAAIYSFNYDVLHGRRCCSSGCRRSTTRSAAASRSSTRPSTSARTRRSPIPADHRFFLSFTLAGLGNFSPFNGALSGVPALSDASTMPSRRFSSPAPPASPAATCSTCCAGDGRATSSPGTGPAARRRATAPASRGRRSICSIAAQVAGGDRAARPAAVYHCAGAAHVGHAWDSTDADLRDQRARHASPARGAASAPALDARVLIPSSALVYARADEALTEDHPLVPASPYGLSKLAQEMLGVQRERRHRPSPSRGRSTTSARGRIRTSSPSGFARRIADIEAGAGRRRSRSATSTRGAISPTCATRSAPTG